MSTTATIDHTATAVDSRPIEFEVWHECGEESDVVNTGILSNTHREALDQHLEHIAMCGCEALVEWGEPVERRPDVDDAQLADGCLTVYGETPDGKRHALSVFTSTDWGKAIEPNAPQDEALQEAGAGGLR